MDQAVSSDIYFWVGPSESMASEDEFSSGGEDESEEYEKENPLERDSGEEDEGAPHWPGVPHAPLRADVIHRWWRRQPPPVPLSARRYPWNAHHPLHAIEELVGPYRVDLLEFLPDHPLGPKLLYLFGDYHKATARLGASAPSAVFRPTPA